MSCPSGPIRKRAVAPGNAAGEETSDKYPERQQIPSGQKPERRGVEPQRPVDLPHA